VFEDCYGPDHAAVAQACANVAVLHAGPGQFRPAEGVSRGSLAIFETLPGPGDAEVGLTVPNPAAGRCRPGQAGRDHRPGRTRRGDPGRPAAHRPPGPGYAARGAGPLAGHAATAAHGPARSRHGRHPPRRVPAVPTLPAIINDLAAEGAADRYNGLGTRAFTTGFLLGPAAACLRLARHLPAAANHTPASHHQPAIATNPADRPP